VSRRAAFTTWLGAQLATALFLAGTGGLVSAQGAAGPATEPAATPALNAEGASVTRKDRRKAERLYLEGSRLFDKQNFEAARIDFELAAALDPANANYRPSALLARSHEVTDLIQQAARARMQRNTAEEEVALRKALELDPTNPQLAEHLQDLAGAAVAGQAEPLYEQRLSGEGQVDQLAPFNGRRTLHLKANSRELIQSVFTAYGIQANVDSSVPASPARLDLDDATFQEASHTLSLVTDTFWVPLDSKRVLVARDTQPNRDQFEPREMETISLQGMSADEMTEVSNLAKNVFQMQQALLEQNTGTLTVRAPARTIAAFNSTLRSLQDGRSQVLLNVRMVELAHTFDKNTGAMLPQQFTAFNVYAEEQAILNANQALVQQIIASGLAAPGDTLAILGILLASGQVTSSIFSNGIALFGGGLTLSGLSPNPASVQLSLNSSASRQLDQVQLRLGDGQEGTLIDGLRYPITMSSFSGLPLSNTNIPGLTAAGNSGGLSSLISSLSTAQQSIPQISYQDLGLTLKATPRVMRNGDVALSMDLKITALAGPMLNGLPVLNNRSYSGVVSLPEGAGVVVVSELNQQEAAALSGVPGLSEIPGMSNLLGNQRQENDASLLIIITPHVVRGYESNGHTRMLRVDGTPRP
jgi:Flp pilus assembly secretin CpaC